MSSTHDYFLSAEAEREREHFEPDYSDYEPERKIRIPPYSEEGLHQDYYVDEETF